LRFSADQRKELLEVPLTDVQVFGLEGLLPVLAEFVQPRPVAQEVRDVLERFQRRAEAEIADLETLCNPVTPAKAAAAMLLAFYLDRPPFTARGVEPAHHEDPEGVMRQVLDAERHKHWAAESGALEVHGRRQVEVSPVPVALIAQTLERGQEDAAGGQLAPSDFVRVVNVCMGAAGGGTDREFERWIKAFRSSRQR
jgi:hypothetical protein